MSRMVKTNTKDKNSISNKHPPYFEMIAEAVLALKERNGSSQPAIAKFIEDKYSKVLPSDFRKFLSIQLRKFVNSDKLVKIKNSYKISCAEKLKLAIKGSTQTAPPTTKTVPTKIKAAENITQRGVKSKKLSQVKTPLGLKNKKVSKVNTEKEAIVVTGTGTKLKRLSQVKTPEALKNKKKSTPMKRKNPNAKLVNSSSPKKKVKKNGRG